MKHRYRFLPKIKWQNAQTAIAQLGWFRTKPVYPLGPLSPWPVTRYARQQSAGGQLVQRAITVGASGALAVWQYQRLVGRLEEDHLVGLRKAAGASEVNAQPVNSR